MAVSKLTRWCRDPSLLKQDCMIVVAGDLVQQVLLQRSRATIAIQHSLELWQDRHQVLSDRWCLLSTIIGFNIASCSSFGITAVCLSIALFWAEFGEAMLLLWGFLNSVMGSSIFVLEMRGWWIWLSDGSLFYCRHWKARTDTICLGLFLASF